MKKAKKKQVKVSRLSKWTARQKLLVGVVAFFVLSTGATIGYSKWKQADLNAKAGMWSYPWYVGDVLVAGCKSPVPVSNVGPLGYQIKIVAKKQAGWRQIWVKKAGGASLPGSHSYQWWGGEAAAVQTHRSELLYEKNGDRFEVRITKGGDATMGVTYKQVNEMPICP